ncbi:zinc-dependent metalloprotease [Mucilaginibacter paludis]|uniref:zinc-dependent metalloprotease n=1 Tax=Mucilaginibacter paludis TaxID=423351 RepID=UPI00145F8E98|nr:zinc-dependent metalloprotease [Mucilaginibacter paludis]
MKEKAQKKNVPVTSDSLRNQNGKVYMDLLKNAHTRHGLINTHQIGESYYLELPVNLLQKDFLLVTRIAKAASGVRPFQQLLGYNGDQLVTEVVRFTKDVEGKIFLRKVSNNEGATDSTANSLREAVKRSNLQPIVASFDIKTFNKDSSSVVFEITKFISDDEPLLSVQLRSRDSFGLENFQKDKSQVESVSVFENKVEILTLKTFTSLKGGVKTNEFITSLILLPTNSMLPRLSDNRVGYSSIAYLDFDSPQFAVGKTFIQRFRLEPTENDEQRYLRGELVEPKKPIIFYIDPATPEKWVKPLMDGVNDWQKAFEHAGFKRAIYALKAPINDSSFNIYDGLHNAIIFKASTLPATRGRRVVDPRSGEILESHIDWFYNVYTSIRDEFFVGAALRDSSIRGMNLSDSLINRIIRGACSLQVGTCLGLQMNFGASSSVKVDSLRSRSYLEKYGFSPSILDPVWTNYVLQPEDNIPTNLLFPKIGIYDEWAVEWGYRWFPKWESDSKEKEYFDKWISQKLSKDDRYRFGEPYGFNVTDPRNQMFDLGNDPIKASELGINNLKKLLAQLKIWTANGKIDYWYLGVIYNKIIEVYGRYINHALFNIEAITQTPQTNSSREPVINFVPKLRQKSALRFISEQLFENSKWITDTGLLTITNTKADSAVTALKSSVVDYILNYKRYDGAIVHGFLNQRDKYSYCELLNDLDRSIWAKLETPRSIENSDRTLQKIYADKLLLLIEYKPENAFWAFAGTAKEEYADISRSDFYPTILSNVISLRDRIKIALPKCEDPLTKAHLLFIYQRLQKVLKPKA